MDARRRVPNDKYAVFQENEEQIEVQVEQQLPHEIENKAGAVGNMLNSVDVGDVMFADAARKTQSMPSTDEDLYKNEWFSGLFEELRGQANEDDSGSTEENTVQETKERIIESSTTNTDDDDCDFGSGANPNQTISQNQTNYQAETVSQTASHIQLYCSELKQDCAQIQAEPTDRHKNVLTNLHVDKPTETPTVNPASNQKETSSILDVQKDVSAKLSDMVTDAQIITQTKFNIRKDPETIAHAEKLDNLVLSQTNLLPNNLLTNPPPNNISFNKTDTHPDTPTDEDSSGVYEGITGLTDIELDEKSSDDNNGEFNFDKDITLKFDEPSKANDSTIPVDVEVSQEQVSASHALVEEPRDLDLENAMDEWSAVDTVIPAIDVSEPKPKTSPITYTEAVEYYTSSEITSSQSEVKTEVERSFWGSVYHRLFGPPQLHKALKPARHTVFSMAACPFDSTNTTHTRILMAIYRQLTGAVFDPPRYGNHWDQVGFQGTDPATDLRSAGMLGLVQLLYLVSEESTQTLARSIYRLSHDESQNFPFCLMGLNVTCMTLNALRHGCLNRECNRTRDVVTTVNNYYIALFFHFYHVWKMENKTMLQSGYVIKDIEKRSLRSSKSVIKQYNDPLSSDKDIEKLSLRSSKSVMKQYNDHVSSTVDAAPAAPSQPTDKGDFTSLD